MGKISKLFKGELKKIFLSVGIFFMSAFLILTLTISPKFFEPNSPQNISTIISLNSKSVKDSYNNFLEEKTNYNNYISDIENVYSDLIANNKDFKNELITISTNIFEQREQLNSFIATGTNSQKSKCVENLIVSVEEYFSKYKNYLDEHYLPLILVTEDLNFNIIFEIDILKNILNKSGDKNSDDFYIEINDALKNYGSAYNLMQYTNQIKNITYSNENLEQILTDYKDKNSSYKNEILNEIEDLKNQATLDNSFNESPSNVKQITNYEYNYLGVDYNYIKILQDKLLIEISKNSSASELSTYLKFENFNSYKKNEECTKYVYLYNNNLNDDSFANVFSFNNLSSKSTKTFDYMYFTLELSSFLIILFTVIIGANTISKEYSEGTIKLLLIRPFSRNKIVFSKVLATLFFGLIFVLIATVVSLITGCILFHGITLSQSVMLIVNSNMILVVPIWLEFLIYLACLLIKIWVYALIAIAISVLFKSNILSVCLSAGIYILNLIVTFISSGASWIKYNIFANLDLFKYLGGSFQLNNISNQNLNNLLTSQVFSGTSILLPAIIISCLSIILNVIIFTVFKNRDLN